MKRTPNMISVMTPFPYSIDLGETIKNAERMLKKHDIRHLPVTKKGEIVGIISERDVVVSLMVSNDLADDAGEMMVADVYIQDAYLVDVTAPLDEVALNMAERHIGSAIVTKYGKLVGIFTSMDACHCLAELLQNNSPTGGNEAA